MSAFGSVRRAAAESRRSDELDGGPVDWVEPADESASRAAALTAIVAAIGVGSGLVFGGLWGAGSGLFFTGALSNAYRAQKWWTATDPSQHHEAVVSGTLAAIEVVAGGYFAYKAHEARKKR